MRVSVAGWEEGKGWRQADLQSKASMVYRASFRTTGLHRKNSVSKRKQKTKKPTVKEVPPKVTRSQC